MNEEKKVVVRSMLVLFLGLAVVYSLAYLKNAPLLEKNLNTIKENTQALQELQKKEENSELNPEKGGEPRVDLQPIILTSSNKNPEKSLQKDSQTTSPEVHQKSQEKNETSLETGNKIDTIASGSDFSSSGKKSDDTSNTLLASPTTSQGLSGTDQFFGILDILDILGIAPEKIYVDSKEIYFASFGKEKIDVGRTVKQLGGTVYTMATEREILDNELFGDKISFINLPSYKNKLVFMFVELNGDTWFIQVPYPQYHKNKAYLKSLFI